jgi:hypothetical protein
MGSAPRPTWSFLIRGARAESRHSFMRRNPTHFPDGQPFVGPVYAARNRRYRSLKDAVS